MSSIDRRVVEMEFDNKQFEAGVRDTLNSLEMLKEGLKLEGATKGITDLEAAGRDFSLEGMASGIDHIADRFSALGAIGFAILQRLTNAAIDLGKKIGSTVMGPLLEGGRRRALNLEQAHFMFEGLGMDAEAVMDNALEAVLGTAFGLDEAAKAASQFGASGMEAGEDMTKALRGISGVAAMTNSSYEDIAQVFTKVAGNGRLMGDDLLRMSSRGLNAAATLAEAFDMTEGEIREMVTAGEVSFEMFYTAMDEAFGEQATRANETYSGSLANLRAAMSRIGASFFTDWLVQQRDLFNTLTPAVDAVGDALAPVISALVDFTGSGTKRLINFIEGINFERLPLLVRPFLGIIQNVFGLIADLVRPIRDAFRQIFPPATSTEIYMILRSIQDFTRNIKMGEDTIENLRRTFAGLFAILGIGWEVVKAGISFFFELFGIASEGSLGFLDATANIGDFLVALHTAIKDGEGLTEFFKRLAGALRTPINFLKNLARALIDLFSFEFEGLDADKMTTGFDALGTVGTAIARSWERVLSVLEAVWDFFKPVAREIGAFFGELGPAVVEAFGDMDFDRVLDIINTSFLGGILVIFRRMVANMGSGVGSAIHRLTGPFGQLTITLKRMQGTLQAMTLMQIAIAVGILAASVLALSKVDAAGLTRALTGISAIFAQLLVATAAFTKMGGLVGITKLSTGLILFAIALRVMVSSVRAMSGLDWDELGRGLAGITVLIAGLIAATRGIAGHAKGMIVAGTGLLILAVGIRILASAVKSLADLGWEELSRGLVGVAGLLASLAIFTRLAAVNKGGIAQGAGLILLATGIKILASAVGDFAVMSWSDIGKGLATIGAILAGFAIFAKIMGNPAGIVKAGASLLIISVAMNALAAATGKFAELGWDEIARGLVAMAGALAIIAVAMFAMKTALPGAVALVFISGALVVLSTALQKMGGMSWDEIARGLVTLAGSLVIIAAAMILMKTALPGAAALVLIAGALAVLAPVLVLLGSMSWESIVRGLAALAGTFIVLGAAGLVLGPIVPILLGLSVAVGLLGIGLLAAGAGVLMFSTGLVALAAAGAAGVAAIISIIEGIIGLIPSIIRALGEGIVALIEVLIEATPLILEFFTNLISSMVSAARKNLPDILELFREMMIGILDLMVDLIPRAARAMYRIMIGILNAMNDYVPRIVRSIINLIVAILDEMAAGVPKMVRAATDLMVAFLNEIAANLGDVITAGADIVIAVIEGIGDNMLRIVEAGAEAVLEFLNGLADAIDRYAPEFQKAGLNIATSIADGITGGLVSKAGDVASSAAQMGRDAVSAIGNAIGFSSPAKEFIKIAQGMGDGLIVGLEGSTRPVTRAAGHLGEDTVETMKRSIAGLADVLNMEMDTSPTITPVIDLSEVRKGAAQIDSALAGQRVDVDSLYLKAKDVSARQAEIQEARQRVETPREEPTPAVFEYNQYNTSPKALSSAEIYRQTKNQLSTVKGALTPHASQNS